eukprot:6949375-Lingulodinium_polyedra.AAC.1
MRRLSGTCSSSSPLRGRSRASVAASAVAYTALGMPRSSGSDSCRPPWMPLGSLGAWPARSATATASGTSS